MRMEFVSNVEEDLRSILSADLGIQTVNSNFSSHLIRLISKNNRVLPCRSFKIRKSNEFNNSAFRTTFTAGLTQIENNFENGRSNKWHQSRGVLLNSNPDLLLNDWGVYHLHLGDTYESNGFCTRTGPVLFCYFDQKSVYFLDILEHGSGHGDVWVNERLLEIMNENWPKHLERFRLRGLKADTKMFSASERTALRRVHANVGITINGNIYGGPGMGLNGAGNSGRYIRRARELVNAIKRLKDWIEAQNDITFTNGELLSEIYDQHDFDVVGSPIQVKLKKENGFLIGYEQPLENPFFIFDLFCSHPLTLEHP